MFRIHSRLRAAIVGFLAFAPIAAGWAHKEWVHPRAFWMFWYDPELIYFHSGRELMAGEVPLNVDNPGTPVQLLSAFLVRVVGGSPRSVAPFLKLAHLVAIAFACASMVLLAVFVLGDLPWPLQVSGVWIFYCCAKSLEYMNVWSPEAFFATFGSIFVMSLWRAIARNLEGQAVFLAGVVLGACCSLKFTFLPLAFAFVFGLLLAAGSRRMLPLIGLGGVVGGFVAGTIPVWRGYTRMFAFLTRLALRGGTYGTGSVAWPDLSVALAHEGAVLTSAKGWYILLCLLVALALVGRSRPAPANGISRAAIGFALAFSVIGIIAMHLVIIRQADLHYLLPTAVCGLVLFRVAAARGPLQEARRLQYVTLLGIGVLLTRHLLLDAAVHDRRVADCLSLHSAIARTIRALGSRSAPVVIFGFRAPEASLALRVMAGDEAFQEEVDQMYPYEGHVTWFGQIRVPHGRRNWDLLVLDRARLTELELLEERSIASAGPFVVFSVDSR